MKNKHFGRFFGRLRSALFARRNRALVLLGALVLALLLAVILLLSLRGNRQLPLPPKTAAPRRLLGLDLSEWQEPAKLDYDKLAAQIDFVILRAGFTGYESGNVYREDNTFEKHYEEFNKRGVPIGAYWYACADTEAEALAEAEALLKMIQGKDIRLPLFWDTEDQHHQELATRQTLTDAALAFIGRIEEAGYRAGLYSHAYWFRDKLQMQRLKDCEIWLANWDGTVPADMRCDILQYTEKGRLTGYEGFLDLNYSNWLYGENPVK